MEKGSVVKVLEVGYAAPASTRGVVALPPRVFGGALVAGVFAFLSASIFGSVCRACVFFFFFRLDSTAAVFQP